MFENHYTREDWLIARKGRITATSVSAILGYNHWSTPYKQWLILKDLVTDEFKENEQMLWGNILEKPIMDEFIKRNGIKEDQYYEGGYWMAVCKSNPLFTSTPDLIFLDESNELVVVDIKTSNQFAWNEPPIYYLIQLIWQMATTGAKRASLVVLHQGSTYKEYHLKRNDRAITALLKRSLTGMTDS
jgi:putative phage-type endonuclease